jgi:hypothetical protein
VERSWLQAGSSTMQTFWERLRWHLQSERGHRATLVPEICVNGLKQTRVRKCRCGAIGVSLQLKAHKLKEEWKRFSSLLIHGNTIAWPLH